MTHPLKIILALLLSATATAQNVVLGVQSGVPMSIDSTTVGFVNCMQRSYDMNHVIRDEWHCDGTYTICNYKKVDSGYQFILSDDNELYIFKDRKHIKTYYSKTTIYSK